MLNLLIYLQKFLFSFQMNKKLAIKTNHSLSINVLLWIFLVTLNKCVTKKKKKTININFWTNVGDRLTCYLESKSGRLPNISWWWCWQMCSLSPKTILIGNIIYSIQNTIWSSVRIGSLNNLLMEWNENRGFCRHNVHQRTCASKLVPRFLTKPCWSAAIPFEVS